MNEFSHFLAMGGYAIYVWSAYAITICVLAGNLIAAYRDLSQQKHAPRS